jgi:hypothetical protein
MAVAALAAWGMSALPASTRQVLASAAEVEPVNDVRDRMHRVLNGQPLSE